MSECPRCELARELATHARLLEAGVAELREGLERELDLDQRLELVAEQHELKVLIERIERRRFELVS